MRCKCCNQKLDSGEINAKNAGTGEYEDTCKECKRSSVDRGVVYEEPDFGYFARVEHKTPVKFFNESEFIKDFVGGNWTGLSDTGSVVFHITLNGSIKQDN